MKELVYLLLVAKSEVVGREVARRLGIEATPSHVRLATLGPLSNFGYPPGSEGAVLRIDSEGVLVGVEGRPEIPRAYVPWTNVAYLADGTEAGRQHVLVTTQRTDAVAVSRGPRNGARNPRS